MIPLLFGLIQKPPRYHPYTSIRTTRTVMLGNRMCFYFDTGNLISSTLMDGFLVLLDCGTIYNCSGSNSNAVVFRGKAAIEVGGYIISNVHLCHFFVKFHLFL